MTVPASLRRWFLFHFIIDWLFGVPLLLFPNQTLALFQFGAESFVMARLLGAGLIGIGGISLWTNRAGTESYLTMLQFKILWSAAAIVALLLSSPNAPQSIWFFILLFLMFFIVWTQYYWRLRKSG